MKKTLLIIISILLVLLVAYNIYDLANFCTEDNTVCYLEDSQFYTQKNSCANCCSGSYAELEEPCICRDETPCYCEPK